MTTAISIEDVRREVKILKALSGHKSLVKFYDACEDDVNVYIVMEYVRIHFFFSSFVICYDILEYIFFLNCAYNDISDQIRKNDLPLFFKWLYYKRKYYQ